MKRNILFVTDRGDDSDGGLSYALDLARMMDKGIAILLVRKNRMMEKFENLMTAVTFAEAGEHETAREMLRSAEAKDDRRPGPSQTLEERCTKSGLPAQVTNGIGDMVNALGAYLKSNRNIEMILLSPSLTEDGVFSAKDFKKLLATVSRPIVTLARPAHVA